MAGQALRSMADLKFKAGEGSLVLGIKLNTLSIVGNSSKAVCTIWTDATVYYLIAFFIKRFMKALKRVHR